MLTNTYYNINSYNIKDNTFAGEVVVNEITIKLTPRVDKNNKIYGYNITCGNFMLFSHKFIKGKKINWLEIELSARCKLWSKYEIKEQALKEVAFRENFLISGKRKTGKNKKPFKLINNTKLSIS